MRNLHHIEEALLVDKVNMLQIIKEALVVNHSMATNPLTEAVQQHTMLARPQWLSTLQCTSLTLQQEKTQNQIGEANKHLEETQDLKTTSMTKHFQKRQVSMEKIGIQALVAGANKKHLNPNQTGDKMKLKKSKPQLVVGEIHMQI